MFDFIDFVAETGVTHLVNPATGVCLTCSHPAHLNVAVAA